MPATEYPRAATDLGIAMTTLPFDNATGRVYKLTTSSLDLGHSGFLREVLALAQSRVCRPGLSIARIAGRLYDVDR